MLKPIFILSKWAYRLMALIMMLLATLLVLAFWLLPQADQLRPRLESYLSNRLALPVALQQLDVELQGFNPSLRLQGLSLGQGIWLEDSQLELDIWASMLALQPRFSTVTASGLWVQISELDSQWRLPDSSGGQLTGFNSRAFTDILHSLGEVQLQDVQLLLTPSFTGEFRLHLPEGTIQARGEKRWLSAAVELTDSRHQARADMLLTLDRGRFGNAIEGYLNITPLALDSFSRFVQIPDLDLQSAQIGGEIWFRTSVDQLVDAQMRLQLPELRWQRGQEEPMAIEDVEIQASLRFRHRGWVSQLHIDMPEQDLILPKQLQLERSLNHFTVFVPELDIGSHQRLLTSLFQLPVLPDLAPTGEMQDLLVSIPLRAPSMLTAQAQLRGLTTQPHSGIPAISGMDGRLDADLRQGQIVFDSPSLQLDFPGLFAEPFAFDASQGNLYWQVLPESFHLVGRELDTHFQGGQFTGEFGVQVPHDRSREPRLDLNLALTDAKVQDLDRYLPIAGMPQAARHWLLAQVDDGQIEQANLAYAGSLASEAQPGDQEILLQLSLSDASLRFLDDWPPLAQARGQVRLDSRAANISLDSGRFMGLVLTEQQLTLSYEQQPVVELQVRGHYPAEDLLAIANLAPLTQIYGELMAPWQVEGLVGASMSLIAPLDGEPLSLDLQLALQANSLYMPELDLRLTDLNGQLQIREDRILSSPLTAKLFGQPVQAQLVDDANASLLLRLSGRSKLEPLLAWLDLDFLVALDGELSYQGNLIYDRAGLQLQLDSDLLAVTSQWPAPFNKSLGEAWPLSLVLQQQGADMNLQLTLADLLAAELVFFEQRLTGGLISQVTEAKDRARVHPNELVVNYRLPSLDLAPWWQFAQQHFLGPGQAPTTAATQHQEPSGHAYPWRQIRFDIGQATLGDLALDRVRAELFRADSAWTMKVNSTQLVGQFGVFDDAELPWFASVDYLALNFPKRSGKADIHYRPEKDALRWLNPSLFPTMDIEIQRLALNGQDYGSWRSRLQPKDRGISFEDLSGVLRGIELQGQLDWWLDQGRHQSRLQLQARTNSMAQVLRQFDAPVLFDTRTASLSTDIKWPGSPAAFKFQTLEGPMRFHLNNGTLYRVSNLEGIKLFGLLNMTRVFQRLAFDFSDIVGEGLTFDGIGGELLFNRGYVSVGEAFQFDSSSLQVRFDGGMNLYTEQVDADALVIIPLTSAIPVAAFVAGVSPQVAGALFITERLIGDELSRLTSLRYLITGHLDDLLFQVYPTRPADLPGQPVTNGRPRPN